jgi:starch synthase
MVASEVLPCSKTGGLADVAAALPRALARLGHEVIVFTPKYRGVRDGRVVHRGTVTLGGYRRDYALHEIPFGDGARILLVDCPDLYDRAGLYHEHGVNYGDNPLRFAVLSAVAVEWAATQSPPVDVLHGHDWQAGLLPILARRLPGVATVFTVHNLAYQGTVDKHWVNDLGLSWHDFHPEGFEFHDRLSFLKAGLFYSQAITTVSPTYATEIQTPEAGEGFDGIVRARRERLTGILNGVDYDAWNPETDEYLPSHYSSRDFSGKARCAAALRRQMHLPDPEAPGQVPLIGLVSRMVEQKGLDLLTRLRGELLSLGAQFAVLGSGEPRYEQFWRSMAAEAPDRVSVQVGYDEPLAHLIEAGSDLFLMPSRFEPCGLNQMYSLRYGTVPVVRQVGGLADSVTPYREGLAGGTGFVFRPYTTEALLAALQDALHVYRERPADWRLLQQRGMALDLSWERSARAYVTVYKGVLAPR